MKRWSGMIKKERVALGNLLSNYLQEKGAIDDPTRFYQHKVCTPVGTLRVSYSESTGAILCRFDDVDQAKASKACGATRMNPYSGKWNFHWDRCSAEKAFQDFKAEFESLK